MKADDFENCTYEQVVEKLLDVVIRSTETVSTAWFYESDWLDKWLAEKNQELDGLTPEDYLGCPEGRAKVASLLVHTLRRTVMSTWSSS